MATHNTPAVVAPDLDLVKANPPTAAKPAAPAAKPPTHGKKKRQALEHSGWKVTRKLRFKHAGTGDTVVARDGDIIELESLSAEDTLAFEAIGAIEPNMVPAAPVEE